MPRVLRGSSFSISRALPLAAILLVAGALRMYGLAWDQGYLFHPDERQILMAASNLEWPRSIAEFLSPTSPLNPHFFSYGSFPIYLLRILSPFAPPSNIAGPWANDFLGRWIVFGRGVSGLFDLGTILFTFLLGRRLLGPRVGLAAAACLAVTVLNIQLAHFYTVDTLLAFFIVATLYCAARMGDRPIPPISATNRWWLATGVCFGLALATKASALPLVAPIALASWRAGGGESQSGRWREQLQWGWRHARGPLGRVGAAALFVFVVTQPYAVIDWYQYGSAVVREGLSARGWLDFPFTRQYAGTVPFVYQIWQSVIWSLGVPLGMFAWGGAFFFGFRALRSRDWPSAFLLSWALVYLLAIGGQYVKYPRYLLPLFPVLYLMAARELFALRVHRTVVAALFAGVLAAGLVYSAAFVSIYGREHPWLAASRWIYESVKPGSMILAEQWDDPLPVRLVIDGVTRVGSEYRVEQLPVQDAENDAKLDRFVDLISGADVIVLSSPRGYGSLARIPERFPIAARYYQALFDGRLGFSLAATFRDDPVLAGFQIADDPRSGLPFAAPIPLTGGADKIWNWGFQDESLGVYDHPQPLVFVRTQAMTAARLRELISTAQK